MRRFLAQWLVSRSLDARREPPHWLRDWLAGDAESTRYEAAARQLATTLRTDAAAWRSIDPTAGQRLQSAQAVGGGWPRWLIAGALASCLAVIVIAWQALEAPSERVAHAPSAADAALFVAAMEEGWLATEEILPFGEPFASWPTLKPALRHSPTVAFSTAAGAATRLTFGAVDEQVRQQRDALGNRVNATVSFFAYRLPSSAAKVVGLPYETGGDETIN
ncbi:hypothetical protein [Lacipirellula parvula]|uniref:Uncharacterized protein n=1 Tax=Lacipirellula parvula TaxID=2650471 RepID=A0A5K7XF91_9BACT|nr:hypothetical protein [Lacipirellula parvula]BBO35055.1 hypothetical protein PLANPX_4667 [Lacipirellula parvula]